MNTDGWDDFYRRWSRLKPPLRANKEVIAAIDAAIQDCKQNVLLLGVTPELCDIAASTVAVDKSESMIERIWPGDTATRRAVLGNWLHMPLRAREFSAVIGDGSFNVVAFDDYATIFAQLGELLVPGARLAMRVYETPARGETLVQLRVETMEGNVKGFHAFKWRLAMAIATETRSATMPVDEIHQTFQQLFPDRCALSAATGWSLDDIGEIDAYSAQKIVMTFPTRAEFLAALPKHFSNPQFVESGSYELAERCPIIVADFAP